MRHTPVEPRRRWRWLAPVVLVVAAIMTGCGQPPPVAPTPTRGETLDTAGMFTPDNSANRAVIESVSAYLRTLQLDDKSLQPGLSIPWSYEIRTPGAQSGILATGTARATGKLGVNGHQIYEVTELDTNGVDIGGGYVSTQHQFGEIIPTPQPPTTVAPART